MLFMAALVIHRFNVKLSGSIWPAFWYASFDKDESLTLVLHRSVQPLTIPRVSMPLSSILLQP